MTRKIPEREEKITAALEDVKRTGMSLQLAADKYGIPRSTLWHRSKGTKPRSEIRSHSNRLSTHEERALIDHALDMDFFGYPLSFQEVAQAANFILSAQNKPLVNSHWARRFVARSSELKARMSRSFDFQRALSEDPEKLAAWFEHFSSLRHKYNIQEGDVYNMDETGFQLGVIQPHYVAADATRSGRSKQLQPGNKEWATAIVCIGGGETVVPPCVIFRGAVYQRCWFDLDLPGQWKIFVSEKGWTSNEVAMKWIQHFNEHTLVASLGRYRMLILDGHVTHMSDSFKSFCEENKIILVFLPPHSSHCSQPLDVACFSPLKHYYSQKVKNIARIRRKKIDKMNFLLCFKEAYMQAMTESNIKGAFRGAGLIPFNPDIVLSRLETKKKAKASKDSQQSRQLPQLRETRETQQLSPAPPRTPSPPASLPSSSTSFERSPTTIEEWQEVFQSLRKDIRKFVLNEMCEKMLKKAAFAQGFSQGVHATAQLAQGNASTVIEVVEKLNSTQKSKGFFDENGNFDYEKGQSEVLQYKTKQEELARRRASSSARHCSNCGKTGHNARTCQPMEALNEGTEMSEHSDTLINDDLCSSPPICNTYI